MAGNLFHWLRRRINFAGLLTARKLRQRKAMPLDFFAKEIRGQQRHPLLGMDQQCTEPSGEFLSPSFRPAAVSFRALGFPLRQVLLLPLWLSLFLPYGWRHGGVVLTDVIQTGIIIVGDSHSCPLQTPDSVYHAGEVGAIYANNRLFLMEWHCLSIWFLAVFPLHIGFL